MLSFDDNLHVHSLPAFADKKNKDLSQQIRYKETKVSNLSAVLDDNVSRADTMIAHMRNVQQEFVHTQALYDAKSKQIETEDHLKQVAERESGRLEVEIKKIENQITSAQDQVTAIQSNIYKTTEEIEAIRSELKFSKEELNEWIKVQNEKQDDAATLYKYSKEDDQRIKQLGLTMEKILSEVKKKKSLLNAEVTETQVSQIELDKTTEEFKALHNERQQLIEQWENAIKTMNKRDNEIQESQALYVQLKERIRQLQSVIDEKQAFLDQEVLANKHTEKKISICDRNVSKFRLEQAEANNSLVQFQDEVEVIRNNLSKSKLKTVAAATELINKRAEIVNLKTERQEKQGKLEKEKKTKANMKLKLADVSEGTMSMEAKALVLQNLLHQEELRSKELDRELKILREEQFKKSQELFKFKQEEKNLAAEIAGSEANSKSLSSKINKLDQEAIKQQALLYAQEFQIQQLERKVRRAQGDRTDEEKAILEKTITELNENLEIQNKQWTLLNTQLKKSQDDLRLSRKNLETLVKEKETVTMHIEELSLYNDSAADQLAGKIKEKEEFMVEENVLRLELRKLKGFLSARADEVFTLESKKLYLQLALEERTKEIQIHKDMLRVQIKNSDAERASAASELRERVGKVEKLKRRYEILMSQFEKSDEDSMDPEKEEHSQAFYVIRASQQREELQREGDELDGKIRKAEKEIKALENTLKLMNDRNEEYRMNIYKAELNSKDVQHQEMLNEQYRNTMEHYKGKREELQDLQKNLNNLETTLGFITTDETQKMQQIQILEAKLNSLTKDTADQNMKLDRAKKNFSKMKKDYEKECIKDARDYSVEDNEEMADLKVREYKDISNVAVTEILRISEKHTEATTRVGDLLSQNNIPPPSKPVSRVVSRANSVMSSQNSSRSVSRLSLHDQSIVNSVSHSRISTSISQSNSNFKSGTTTPKLVQIPSTKTISLTDITANFDIKKKETSRSNLSTSQKNLNSSTKSVSNTHSKAATTVDLNAELIVKSASVQNSATSKINTSKRPVRVGSATSISSRGSSRSK
ncbi:Coiled-coil domain-containing protein 39 [Lobulomyces angularis]|nr:Coiled-coil domain-containing protein 39 [Lobulomyces angularis]